MVLSFSHRVCRPFFCGRKPSKKNFSHGKPDKATAQISADGPGRQVISTLFSWHARTRRKPGSEIDGVPASDTRAMSLSFCRYSITFSNALCSLCAWKGIILVDISKCLSRKPVFRVSSARIRSTSFSTSSARSVMSPRFPIGVGTR